MSGLQERFALLTVSSPPNMVSANLDKVANLDGVLLPDIFRPEGLN
jgi:hypothetical protein